MLIFYNTCVAIHPMCRLLVGVSGNARPFWNFGKTSPDSKVMRLRSTGSLKDMSSVVLKRYSHTNIK